MVSVFLKSDSKIKLGLNLVFDKVLRGSPPPWAKTSRLCLICYWRFSSHQLRPGFPIWNSRVIGCQKFKWWVQRKSAASPLFHLSFLLLSYNFKTCNSAVEKSLFLLWTLLQCHKAGEVWVACGCLWIIHKSQNLGFISSSWCSLLHQGGVNRNHPWVPVHSRVLCLQM